ncbi:MAG: hypothetical protein LKJ69_08165 [Lactobacillus sp.]|jgi:uncharacterized protein YgbK (DUF1537 family)|nr:hypothetical protein [Lactobacillus sp.]MCI2033364.1 hypothetical protein [Lactobacillus sp.]
MKTVIVADDLTGANVSNSLLAKNGFRVGSLDELDPSADYSEFDALGLYTDSRGLSAEAAKTIVHDVTSQAQEHVTTSFFNKRIDSTLRGNVGAEIDGMLDALPADTVAMVVPAFPSGDKIVIGNYMLVNGTPLENTDVRNDPTSPVHSSRVSTIIRQQSQRSQGVVSMETILNGPDEIQATIDVLVANGAQIILFDATTDADIAAIATAVLKTRLPFIAVDPGPFTNALVAALTPPDNTLIKQKQLFIIGTVSGIVVDQLADLKATLAPYIAKIDPVALLEDQTAATETKRVVDDIIAHLADYQILAVATMIERTDKIDLPAVAAQVGLAVHDASERIVHGVAEIGYQISQAINSEIGGLYTSGGDVTKAFLAQTQASGVEIKDEIIPLAVYGRVIGGTLAGKAIVTKGGLVGDRYTITQCATYLATKISDAFYGEKVS